MKQNHRSSFMVHSSRFIAFCSLAVVLFLVLSFKFSSKADAAAPTITIGGNIATNSAMQTTLYSTVAPNGVTTTTFFMWGKTDPGLGQSNCSSATFPNVTTSQTVPSNYPATPVTGAIPGLIPGVTYYYCAVAYNSAGVAFTPVRSFAQDSANAAGGCPSVPLTTDYTASSDCKFANPTVDGVDKGSGTSNDGVLTVAKGTTLTVSAGQTVAYGILYKPGATLTRVAGGSVRRGAIWSQDTDGDGYPDYGDVGGQTVAATQPSGYIRRTTAATRNVDCAPNNASLYQNLLGYVDNDGDGYTTLATGQPACVGASYTGSGYASSSSGVDCDDSSVITYQTQTVGTDADGDGYSTGAASAQCVGASSVASGRTYYVNGLNAAVYVAQGNILGTNECNDTTASYTTTCPPYNVTTTAASSIATNSAGLNSTINPNNTNTNVVYRYQTGATATCNASTPASAFNGPSGLAGTADRNGGSTQGAFGSGLIPNTTYYFCATANNSFGTTYGSVLNFTTLGVKPRVTAQSVTSVASLSASFTATVNPNNASTNVIYRYSTTNQGCSSHAASPNAGPTSLTGTSDVSPNTTATGTLIGNTTYYYCATAVNATGTTNAVNDGNSSSSFLTKPGGPTSGAAGSATSTTLTITWSAPAGGATSYNVFRCDRTASPGCAPSTDLGAQSSGFSSGGLTCNNSYAYFVRANNATGSSDSGIFTGTTGSCVSAPSISSPTAVGATPTTETVGGNITSDGGASITGRGVCVGTSVNPINGTGLTGTGTCFTTSGTTGVFTVSATGLSVNTAYHYRAYGTNSVGTTYTTDTTFTTFCYRDADGDTYGSTSGPYAACSGGTYIVDGTDCYDSGTYASSAHPGQTLYYTSNRGDGSFDYNCVSGNEVGTYGYACTSTANTYDVPYKGGCNYLGTTCTASSITSTCGAGGYAAGFGYGGNCYYTPVGCGGMQQCVYTSATYTTCH